MAIVISRKWQSRKFVIRASALLLAAILSIIAWRVFAAPTLVNSITPNVGPSTGGTNVLITGSGFTDFTPKLPLDFDYSGGCTPWTIQETSSYLLETWGAQGGNAGAFAGGRGGYSKGVAFLTAGTVLHICVGGQGSESQRTQTTAWPGGFNGGGGAARNSNGNGKETASGGGATDIRIGTNSIFSRVLVAGGGGGAAGNNVGSGNNLGSAGGAGGGTVGLDSPGGGTPAFGGTQNAGGANGSGLCAGGGVFGGAASTPCGLGNQDMSGGGGGWFGGGSGAGAGGGSGFAYGPGSDVSTGVIGGPWLLNSNYFLSDVRTVDGGNSSAVIPSPMGGTQAGQSGNGYARLTQLPYSVTIGGVGCNEVQVLSATQISCVTPAHSAGPATVEVWIDGATGQLVDGFTYTDKLTIAGPDQINVGGGIFNIGLDYEYTGLVTLSDGGLGGTWVGASVVNGNQIQYNNTSSAQVTYIPPTGYGGEITLSADSGVSYVTNATKEIVVAASAYTFTCFDQNSGVSTSNPFIVPGTSLDCQIILNGPFAGTMSLADLVSGMGSTKLGGSFSSSDGRLNPSTGVFTTNYVNTGTIPGQTLLFTYTAPTWGQIMGTEAFSGVTYNGSNGLSVFWPVLTTAASPFLSSTQNSMSVGLLAQEYEIFSRETPAIDSPSGFGCIGCTAMFGVRTFGAPYFGSVILSSDDALGVFSYGLSTGSTATINFSGSGGDETFQFTPNTVASPTTITGSSSSPAIVDSSISFDVRNSHINIVCDEAFIARGQSVGCTLAITVTGATVMNGATSIDIAMQDILFNGGEIVGGGSFVDTTNDGSWNSTTLVYSFCYDENSTATCASASYSRTFTYTLPAVVDMEYVHLRIEGSSEEYIPAESSWALLDVIAESMTIYCSSDFPDCAIGRVGMLQDYIIKPDGVFYGEVSLTDNNGGSFSDGGIASWSPSGDGFDFTYSPASPGVKTITATVTEVNSAVPSDIEVGHTYTFLVNVMANLITIDGPSFVALDGIPYSPAHSVVLNGPYVGTITLSLWDASTNTQLGDMGLTGTNVVNNYDGTYSCSVTLSMYENDAAGKTTACSVNNIGIEGYNYLELRAVPGDAYTSSAAKTIGIVSDSYEVTLGGSDATVSQIFTTMGTPLSFVVSPNALFAGNYSVNDGGAGGIFNDTSVNMLQSNWPAADDQTIQSRTFVYLPSAPGIVTLTFNATRGSIAGSTIGGEDFGNLTVELVVLADTMTLSGPSQLVRGATGQYTMTLNGPFVGTVEFADSLEDELVETHLSISSCDFTLADYIDGETSCSFDFTLTTDTPYVNMATLFSTFSSGAEGGTTKQVRILADDFSVVPGPILENQRVATPLEFAVTPNAMFDGEFDVAFAAGYNTSFGPACPASVSEFYAVFDPTLIEYGVWEFDTVAQTPLSKTFTATARQFGGLCVLVTPTAYDDTPYTEAGVTLEPQMIEMHFYEGMFAAGPGAIFAESADNEYGLVIYGHFSGTVDFWVVDPTTCNPSDPYDCGSPLSDVELGGDYIYSNGVDTGSCDLTPADADPVTALSTCAFTITMADTFVGNWIRILSTSTQGDKDYYDVAILATDFEVTPSIVVDAEVDVPIEYTITPLNGLYSGTFTLNDGGSGGLFSPTSVTFTSADWPSDQTPMAGKTFEYAPAVHGHTTIYVNNGTLGTREANIYALADTMIVSGPEQIQRDNEETYTLTINGPYQGTIEFTVIDTATGLEIPGLVMDKTSCAFLISDMVGDTTTCQFTVTVPGTAVSTNRIEVQAAAAMGDRALTSTNAISVIDADGYVLSPTARQVVGVGDVITFSISVDGYLVDVFDMDTDGSSVLSAPSVAFTPADFPSGVSGSVSKTFTVTTTVPGVETLTVHDPWGNQKTVEIVTLADTMSLSGDAAVRRGVATTYTLTIDGPYEGTVDLSVVDKATGLSIPSLSMSATSCTFTIDGDYDELENVTVCTFTVTVPTTATSTNYIDIMAESEVSSPELVSTSTYSAVLADGFTVSPNTQQVVGVGTVVEFTIAVDGFLVDTFNLSTDGASTLSSSTVGFGPGDFPTTLSGNASKTFTVTTTQPGIETLTVSNPFGGDPVTIQIVTVAATNALSLAGPTTVTRGVASSNYTLTIAGPYTGTIDLSAEDTATSAVITGLSKSSCALTFDDFNTTTGETVCTFTITVPTTATDTNNIRVNADVAGGSPTINSDSVTSAVNAESFTLSPNTQQIVGVGDVITFTIAVDGYLANSFNLSTDGDSTLSASSVSFSSADFPLTLSGNASKTFTLTTTAPGIETLTVSNPFGGDPVTVEIVTVATDSSLTLTGPATVTRGVASSNYTLTIAGPYTGTIDLSVVDTATSSAITGLSTTSCAFTFDDYVDGETVCTFTMTVPTSATSTNNIRVSADVAGGSPTINSDDVVSAVTADGFTLTPNTQQVVGVGDVITFTIAVDGYLADTFDLSTDGDSTLSASSVSFSSADFPLTLSGNASKTFTVTTTTPGIETLTVSNPFGSPVTVEIVTVAESSAMSISGPSAILREDAAEYKLVIAGPYAGTINLAVTDTATGSGISGLVIADFDSGDPISSCTFTFADYNATTGETVCEFTVTVPDSANTTNEIEVSATAVAGDMDPTSMTSLVMAGSYTLSPETEQVVGVGDVITFTIAVDGYLVDTFDLSIDGASILSANSVSFSESDFPGGVGGNVSKTFTVTTTQPGVETLTVSDPFGGEKMVRIVTLAPVDSMNLTGPSSVTRGAASSNYTLTIDGPYEGTVNFSVVDVATNGAISSLTITPTSCDFVYDDFGTNGETTCTFTVTVPTTATDTNRIEVRATTAAGDMDAASTRSNVIATSFTVTPNTQQVATVGEVLSFQIAVDGYLVNSFNLSTDGDSTLSTSTVSFASGDFPDNLVGNATKSFTLTTTTPGIETLTISNPFGGDPVTIEIVTLATVDSMNLTGPSSVTRGTASSNYTLTIDGPYEGTVNFSVVDVATNGAISSLAISPSSCSFTYDDFGANGETTCTFTVTVPTTATDTNRIEVRAVTAAGDMDPASTRSNVAATSFTVTPNTQQIATVGEVLSFQIAVDGYLVNSFNLSTDGASTLSTSTVSFASGDFPDSLVGNATKGFTVTTTVPGIETLTVSNPFGGDPVTIEIVTLAEESAMSVTGPATIARGVAGNYSLVISGPYAGTINLSTVDTATSAAVGGLTMSATSCTFTFDDYIDGETVCNFTVTVPTTATTTNHILVSAASDGGSPTMDTASRTTAVLASEDYVLSPTADQVVAVGDVITFSITVDGYVNDNFVLGISGGSTLSASTVPFSSTDFPIGTGGNVTKTFTVTTTQPGKETLTVTDPWGGIKNVTIYTLAEENGMSVSGPNSVGRGVPATYTLTIDGPYEGTVDFSVTDAADGTTIAGLTMSPSSCTFTLANYNATLGTTSCTFSVTVPTTAESTNRIEVLAETAMGSPVLTPAAKLSNVGATGFELSPTATQIVAIGDVITFSISVNGFLDDSFGLSVNGGSVLSSSTLTFGPADFPEGTIGNVTKTFTVTTTQVGKTTLTVIDPFAGDVPTTVTIYTLAEDMTITGPDRIQEGTTSGTFTLTVEGPYDGIVEISAYLPDGGSGSPATGVVLSQNECEFTIAGSYNEVTNQTTCTFTATVDDMFGYNWIGITATAPGLAIDPIVAITAGDYDLETDYVAPVLIGTPVTFTIDPTLLFDGTFTLSDGGLGGTFSPTNVTFSDASWPTGTLDQTRPAGKTFTYRPATDGDITITTCNTTLGCRSIIIAAYGEIVEPPEPPETGSASSEVAMVVAGSGGVAVIAGAATVWLFMAKRKKQTRKIQY